MDLARPLFGHVIATSLKLPTVIGSFKFSAKNLEGDAKDKTTKDAKDAKDKITKDNDKDGRREPIDPISQLDELWTCRKVIAEV